MNVGKEPLLTIVVPAYNVEKYLGQCLDSLVNQTVMDHKIIVIDDGAKDHTGQIADDYHARYPELITVIHQENHGLGAARNRAFEDVVTPYVAFLDSDDWQNQMFVERIKQVLDKQDEQPDIIFTLPWIYDEGSKRIMPWYDKSLFEDIFFPGENGRNGNSLVVNAKKDPRLYALEANTNRRVYRSSFLREIGFSFQEGTKWEDVRPHFHAIHSAKRCIGVANTGFFYRINTGGQITAGGGASRLDIIPVFQETLDRAFTEKWDTQDVAYIIQMMQSFSMWSINVTNTEFIAPLLDGLHKMYKNIPWNYFKAYLNLCSPQKKRDWVLIHVIRSPFYMVLKDYRSRAQGLRIANKLRRILRRG